jgi:Na+/H+-dicarboxylate symporter
VPPEGIAVILGVDRLLDTCRTVPNVTGDLVLATVVARSDEADILREEPPPPTGAAPSGPRSAALTPPSP